MKGKLRQGFASAADILLETQRFITSDTFLQRSNDLKGVLISIEKVVSDLQWCKNIINKHNQSLELTAEKRRNSA